ncbi:hypothetical protein KUTeg_002026 [Tegillarca granosa]|uniref:EGF-like domain-containing protein n=1 Tax=Tegillarca granosa TaxID=220873 RepID=A0ABQ9FT50_TEGGR|nr:hypothetical protein KUTeg_002026 [Tegillarca granosa]
MFSRVIFMDSVQSTTQVELTNQAKRPLNNPPFSHKVVNYTIPVTPYVNKYYLNTSTGCVGAYSQKLIPIPPSTDPPRPIVKIDYAVAPFYCELGCGGNNTNEFDITQYQFGICQAQDICLCNPGYYGDQCQFLTCSCVHGYCDIPNVCICQPADGWTGARCETPLCTK